MPARQPPRAISEDHESIGAIAAFALIGGIALATALALGNPGHRGPGPLIGLGAVLGAWISQALRHAGADPLSPDIQVVAARPAIWRGARSAAVAALVFLGFVIALGDRVDGAAALCLELAALTALNVWWHRAHGTAYYRRLGWFTNQIYLRH